MARFFRTLGRTRRAVTLAFEPGRFTVAGTPVRCDHCAGVTFVHGHALLNTAGMTLLNLDWLDEQAAVLICESCGRVHWFAREPERIPD